MLGSDDSQLQAEWEASTPCPSRRSVVYCHTQYPNSPKASAISFGADVQMTEKPFMSPGWFLLRGNTVIIVIFKFCPVLCLNESTAVMEVLPSLRFVQKKVQALQKFRHDKEKWDRISDGWSFALTVKSTIISMDITGVLIALSRLVCFPVCCFTGPLSSLKRIVHLFVKKS